MGISVSNHLIVHSCNRILASFMCLSALLVFTGCETEKVSTKPWKNYIKVGDDAREHGDWSEAEKNYAFALREAEQFRPDSRRLAYTLTRVGWTSQSLRNYDKAERMFQRRVELDVKCNLTNTTEYADALVDLASARKYACKYNEAENAYLQAESVFAFKFGDSAPILGILTAQRAELYTVQGRLEDAEVCYKRSSDQMDFIIRSVNPTSWIRGRILIESGHMLNGYGLLKARQKKYAEAEALLKESISRLRQQLGGASASLTTEWNNLATVYAVQGKWTEAETAAKNSIDIIAKNKTTGHPAVASTQNLFKRIQSREPFPDIDTLFKPQPSSAMPQ